MAEKIIAYVDGFNLYYGLYDARGRRDLWLDLESLLDSFVEPSRGQTLGAVNYFTALVNGPGGARQQAYLDALAAHGRRTTVWLGRFQRKEHRCRVCSATWSSYEEKETDVALSVRAVQDAVSGAADQVWFVSGDSDLCPSARTVAAVAPGPVPPSAAAGRPRAGVRSTGSARLLVPLRAGVTRIRSWIGDGAEGPCGGMLTLAT